MPRANRERIDKPISPPALAAADLLGRWVGAGLTENEVYLNLLASQLNLSNQTARGIKFDGVDLNCADLSGTKLLGLKLVDTRLTQCDLANADWHGAELTRVEMIECRMVGFTITEGKPRDCVFTRCNGSYMRSRFSWFKAARFVECNLREADFQGADLSGVDFTRCDLRNAQMSGAKLKGASLRGSNIEGLAVNAKDLEGVIVDPMQAANLAPLFGLKVVW